MASYTITIRTDGGDAETLVRVDDSGKTIRVTEVSVRATSDLGLSAQQPPAIDLDLLTRAFNPNRATSSSQATAESAPARGRKATSGAAGGRRIAKQTTAPKATKARVRRTATAQLSRNYRRTPDDLAATFARLGGTTAVATHYGVPRHTAQGWIARLRHQG